MHYINHIIKYIQKHLNYQSSFMNSNYLLFPYYEMFQKLKNIDSMLFTLQNQFNQDKTEIQQCQNLASKLRQKNQSKNKILKNKLNITPYDYLVNNYFVSNPKYFIWTDFQKEKNSLTTTKRLVIPIQIINQQKKLSKEISNLELELLIYNSDKQPQIIEDWGWNSLCLINQGKGTFRIKICLATTKIQGKKMHLVIKPKHKEDTNYIQSLVIGNIQVKTKNKKINGK